MIGRITSAILLFLITTAVSAQKPVDDALEKSKELRKRFEDASIALTESNLSYRFYIDSKTRTLKVENHESAQFLSLKSNTEYIIRNFYDDNSSIDSYQILNSKGKNYNHSKYCGHYQMENIFYSDARLCAYNLRMPLAGEQISYSSVKTYNDPKYLTKVFFHEDVPVEKRKIEFQIPDGIQVELLEMNFNGFEIKKKEEKTTTEKKIVYEIENLDGRTMENNVPGHLHFLPHILVLTKSYRHDGKDFNLLSSTDDLYQWYASLIKKMKNEPDKLVDKVKEITEGITDDEKKIKVIYYWVQDNIKYIAFVEGLAGFQPEDAHKVYYNRYGDCKGMSNLLKEMLVIAGFDARLTWIGTNIIPYSYDVPSLAVDNHMICTVFSNGKKYILDPTEELQTINGHAERIQGREILIENGEKYIRDKVPIEPLSRNLEEKKITYKLSDKSLTAEGVANYNGEPLKNILYRIKFLDEDKVDVYLRNMISGAGNSNYFTMQNHSVPDRDEVLKIMFHGKLDNQLNTYDKEVYLTLDYEKDFKDLKMTEKRKSPFDFGRKIYRTTTAELAVPKGYKIQYFPQPLVINDDNYQFDLRYEVKDNKIKYIKEIKIINSIISVSDFEKWNKAISQLNSFYNDQIILQTIN